MKLTRGGFARTRNHWYWRAGWGPGARYLTFHLTFEQAPEMASAAAPFGARLRSVTHVDVVPLEWLHLTMTGVGFADEVETAQLRTITRAVFNEVDRLDVGLLLFDTLWLYREGFAMSAELSPWLAQLKAAQEQAVERVLDEPRAGEFHPHVSLAYFSGEVDEDALARAVREPPADPVLVARPALSLIELNRDDRVYTWRVLERRVLSGG